MWLSHQKLPYNAGYGNHRPLLIRKIISEKEIADCPLSDAWKGFINKVF